jgi:hypothetical protein
MRENPMENMELVKGSILYVTHDVETDTYSVWVEDPEEGMESAPYEEVQLAEIEAMLAAQAYEIEVHWHEQEA